jgi:protein-L-isoaspartate O-methyltransferase
MEAQVYERMAELDSDHWWFVARRDILQNLIERVVQPPKNARILEIGCGTGHNLAMLSKFGKH